LKSGPTLRKPDPQQPQLQRHRHGIKAQQRTHAQVAGLYRRHKIPSGRCFEIPHTVLKFVPKSPTKPSSEASRISHESSAEKPMSMSVQLAPVEVHQWSQRPGHDPVSPSERNTGAY
jgi:hypothetical protein